MHVDPLMINIVGATLVLLLTAWLVRLLNQPHVVGYLLAGIIIGPHGLALFTDQALVGRIGEIGVVLLLFFAGMEVSPRKLASRWRVTLLGTLAQILVSLGVVWLIGRMLGWTPVVIVLVGFVLSLSSTAVVLNYLQERGEFGSRVGQDVMLVLLAQDVAVIPMLIVLGVLGGEGLDFGTLALQSAGALVIGALVAWISIYTRIRLPLGRRMREDHELQVFGALALCLGLALLTGLLELSPALGAFVAGMIVGAARETGWVHNRLEPFRVLFVALFFASIGLLVNVDYVLEHAGELFGLLAIVFVLNTGINMVIFRVLGESWRYSAYAGAILAQVGEFSFVLAAFGYHAGFIEDEPYQMIVAVIALSLLLGPAWIALSRAMLGKRQRFLREKAG